MTEEAAARPTVDREGRFETEGRVALFGFEATRARATVLARSKAWRVGGAARTFALFVVIAPMVAIFPPHAVWFLGALTAGGVLARRRYIERFTLVALDAVCPKCGGRLSARTGRLKQPHPLPCEGCNHDLTLRLPDEVLAAALADR